MLDTEALKAKLTEYDIILLVDRSGSMREPAKGFSDRWHAAKELTVGIATLGAQVDEDGITVITFGGTFDVNRDLVDGVKDAQQVSDLFTKFTPGGSTPTADAIKAAFDKKFASGKKAIIVVVTDGEPNDEGALAKTIADATQKISSADDIKVIFCQVGDNAAAAAFLSRLDNSIPGAQFDIVNAITFADADGLSGEALLSRALEDSH